MPEVHVLVEGYYRVGPPVQAVATTSLVLGAGFAWVVDPGTAPQSALLEALARQRLQPTDIDTLFLTHSHMDHIRNAGLFPGARVLDAWGWWEGDIWRAFDGVMPPGLALLPTPGHSTDMLTLLVNSSAGRIAICGDVTFNEALLHAEDPFAEDPQALHNSRTLVLSHADIIVPGHGAAFRVNS